MSATRAEITAACYANPTAFMRLVAPSASCTRHLGYLVAERGRGNWYYGHRGPGWGPGWESRGKVDPMRIGKARAALRREQDRARKYGYDPSLLAIVEVVETLTEVM